MKPAEKRVQAHKDLEARLVKCSELKKKFMLDLEAKRQAEVEKKAEAERAEHDEILAGNNNFLGLKAAKKVVDLLIKNVVGCTFSKSIGDY